MPRAMVNPRELEQRELFAKKLSDLIRQSGKTMLQCANGADIPVSTLNNWKRGKSLPGPENLKRLSDFFHVDKSDLDPRYDTKYDYNVENDTMRKLFQTISFLNEDHLKTVSDIVYSLRSTERGDIRKRDNENKKNNQE